MRLTLAIKILIVGLIAVLTAAGAFAGTIRGSVIVKGLRSPENILVYLPEAPSVEMDLTGTRFIMDQQKLTFLPHVLPVPVGSAVEFPNNDEVAHNVFSLSRTKQFNLGSFNPGEKKTVVFDKPGIVELRCDVHAEMAAYIMVMKNPYFGITDKNGNFRIPDNAYMKKLGISGVPELPEGSYTLKTRHEKLKSGKNKIQVPAEGDVRVEMALTRGTPGVLYK